MGGFFYAVYQHRELGQWVRKVDESNGAYQRAGIEPLSGQQFTIAANYS